MNEIARPLKTANPSVCPKLDSSVICGFLAVSVEDSAAGGAEEKLSRLQAV